MEAQSTCINSPIGTLRITSNGTSITEISVTKNNNTKNSDNPLLSKCVIELKEYFEGKRSEFSVPIDMEGSAFEKTVWNAMRKIPLGHTKSYAEIAREIGKAKAARAIGNACGKNPLLIITPCHRVTATNGLGGFSSGIEKKKWLLAHERRT